MYTNTSFSDGAGGMGAIVFDQASGENFVCARRVPAWFIRALEHRASQINQFELLALVSAVMTFGPSHMGGREVLFFCDNTCALSAAVHGYSGSAELGALCNALHLEFARLACRPWFEWVPSKANPADVPSRTLQWQELYDTLGLRWWPGGFQLPDLASSWMP